MRSACAISGREIARIDTEITEYKIPLFLPFLPFLVFEISIQKEKDKERDIYRCSPRKR